MSVVLVVVVRRDAPLRHRPLRTVWMRLCRAGILRGTAPGLRPGGTDHGAGIAGRELIDDTRVARVLMADVLTLTGRIRNLSSTGWEVGSGPGRWSVAGYLTRIGRRKQWVREPRTSPPDSRVPQHGELEFALPIDTRGLPAGIYEVWIDMLMDRRNWMALHGAVPGAATLRIESFTHDIAVDADAMSLPPGGTAVLSGTVRNTCGKPWPRGAGGEPLKLGARLFRQSVNGQAVREFRAPLDGLPETPADAVGFRLADTAHAVCIEPERVAVIRRRDLAVQDLPRESFPRLTACCWPSGCRTHWIAVYFRHLDWQV